MNATAEKPVTFGAHPWFKNGDHPKDYASTQPGLEGGELRNFSGAERKAKGWEGEVVRYFRHPSIFGTDTCAKCSVTMHWHGFIDQGEGQTVCPGDMIVTTPSGKYHAVKPEVLEAFEKGEGELPFEMS